MNVKLRLTIGDRDAVYIDHLLTYLRRSEFREKMTVQSFTSREHLQQHLEKEEPDILLVTPDLLTSPSSSSPLTILLTEDKLHLPDHHYQHRLFKYQSLHHLLMNIMNLYGQHHQIAASMPRAEKTKVISFYSAAGGAGKTTSALNLARELALMQHKIFYLNLEYLPSFTSNLSTEDQYSRVLYHLKSSPHAVASRIEKYISSHDLFHFDYFPPLLASDEILDVDAQDSSVLIDSIIRLNYYDYIIIDLESSLHERIVGALEYSDWIIWLLVHHPFDIGKTDALLRLIRSRPDIQGTKILSRTLYLLNKTLTSSNSGHTDPLQPNLISSLDITVNGYLPYIPEWKNIQNIEGVMSSMTFRNELIKLIYQHLPQLGENVT